MGTIRIPSPVKLFAGLLYAPIDLDRVEIILKKMWGPIQLRSEGYPFSYTHYYDEELGAGIERRFYAFEKNIDPEEIRELKLEANHVELENAVNNLRKWNIDPGYIDLDKIVLATTKPATYRVYLGKGIYAQSTLYYKDKTYHPWPWTYPDYKEKIAIDFFSQARNYGHH